MKLNFPKLFNDKPTRSYIRKHYPHVEKVGLAVKIADRIWLRTRLAESQNWRCCWCGVECRPEAGFANSVTIEHVIPRSEGGGDNQENLAMACRRCNATRGSQDAEEFFESRKWAKMSKMTAHERRQEKKLRSYIVKARRLQVNNWVTASGKKIADVNVWLSSLRLGDKNIDRLKQELDLET